MDDTAIQECIFTFSKRVHSSVGSIFQSKYYILLILSIASVDIIGQEIGLRDFVVQKIDSKILLDGNLDEEIWQTADGPNNFWQYFPTDSLGAKAFTDIKMIYTDDALYVGISCSSVDDKYIINSLKRDFRAGGNDNITLIFDSFNDGTNAFMFGTNPYGVLREGLISGGGQQREDFTTSWDNKWKCEARIDGDKWYAEMMIPFSTLRYIAGGDKWRFNSYRFDMQENETSTWTRIPRNQVIFSLSFMGDMKFEEPLGESKSGAILIPFLTSGFSKDYENNEDGNFTRGVGGDAKVALTSSLNLDLTLNPDFSQVEVDRQVTDLSRFEIFFPERRQFFIENADLFSAFGSERNKPFFSRRIGVATDTTTDNTVQNTIYAGARLSGKIGKDWRVGLINMQTASEPEIGIEGNNYSVASIQKKIGARSFVSGVVVNRQSTGNFNLEGRDRFNRVIGLDYNLASADNSWVGKTFLHRSFGEVSENSGWSHGTRLQHRKYRYQIDWNHEVVEDTYAAEVGFVRRSNFYSINPELELFFYPQESWVNKHGPQISLEQFWQPGLGRTDQTISAGYEIRGRNSERLSIGFNRDYVYLFSDFDPTGTDSSPLLEGSEYTYSSFELSFSSDSRKIFSYSFNTYLGQYFQGSRQGLRGQFSARFQPHINIGLNYSFNRFDMNYLDNVKYTYLLGPDIDLTFSKSVFLTTFLQYNSQSQNTNINIRFQYRFAPVSDFFLVWAENYLTSTGDPSDRFAFNIKNRSIVAKFTYWLNM